MIKIQEVQKLDGAYTIVFTDGLACYGVLVEMFQNKPIEIEFMEMKPTDKDPVLVTKGDNPEEYKILENKYLAPILAYIDSL